MMNLHVQRSSFLLRNTRVKQRCAEHGENRGAAHAAVATETRPWSHRATCTHNSQTEKSCQIIHVLGYPVAVE